MIGTCLAFGLMAMMQISAALFRAEKWRLACPCFMVAGIIIGIAIGHMLTENGSLPINSFGKPA